MYFFFLRGNGQFLPQIPSLSLLPFTSILCLSLSPLPLSCGVEWTRWRTPQLFLPWPLRRPLLRRCRALPHPSPPARRCALLCLAAWLRACGPVTPSCATACCCCSGGCFALAAVAHPLVSRGLRRGRAPPLPGLALRGRGRRAGSTCEYGEQIEVSA